MGEPGEEKLSPGSCWNPGWESMLELEKCRLQQHSQKHPDTCGWKIKGTGTGLLPRQLLPLIFGFTNAIGLRFYLLCHISVWERHGLKKGEMMK